MCYTPGMTVASRIALSTAGLAVIGAGAILWAHYGSLVYFDTLASAFIGCFI